MVKNLSRRETMTHLAGFGAGLGASLGLANAAEAHISALGFKVQPKIDNAVRLIPASQIRLQGWLGGRVSANAHNRLLNVDTVPLLAGYIQKPGSHPWIGEHIGKWMHAATLAWANTGDPRLRTKLDEAVTQLIKAQEPDGYLGTYVPEKRFGIYDGADWDVWSHKYCLLGLLTYYRYTQTEAALTASKKAADLLIATFPAKRSILVAGTHMGMAATSVLEPMVLLYNLTGETKYLDFANYIVASWKEPGGPNIVDTLLTVKKVNKTANSKAYEMLSNLVGLSDLARVTGDRAMIEACLNAWQDIIDHHLYITGSASRWEHFQSDGDYRADLYSHIAETCVTTTWIQFNQSLLQLTGQARFGDDLERSYYNHLAAAQHPNGEDWVYYTPLEGRKHFDKVITCCHSSGPRGMALAPMSAILEGQVGQDPAILINSFETLMAQTTISGQSVRLTQTSQFPYEGRATLNIQCAEPVWFAVKIRAPAWARPMRVAQGIEKDGWITLPARLWRNGDKIDINFTMHSRILTGKGSNQGREALAYGPFILAADQNANANIGRQNRYALAGPARILSHSRALNFVAPIKATPNAVIQTAGFKTFADVGAGDSAYRVWLRARGREEQAPYESVLIEGKPVYSRHDPASAHVNSEDYEDWASTQNGQKADEDWFGIELPSPKTAITFVFNHGQASESGGWFDTSAGKPVVEIKATENSPWQVLGWIDHYPLSDAKTNPFNEDNTKWDYRLDLDTPVSFVAVRVHGKPASGNRPDQNYVTCRQLTAFNWL